MKRIVRYKYLIVTNIAGFIISLLITAVVSISGKLSAADHATEFIRRSILSGDLRQTFLTLNNFSADRFSWCGYYDARGNFGSGLGVYSAKALVEKVGGRFAFSSELGHGSKVVLQLPIAQ